MPGWLAMNPVRGTRKRSMQLQKLQFQCDLRKSWTRELTSEFCHARLTIFSTVWDAGWFYKEHASRRNAKLSNNINIFRVKTAEWREKMTTFQRFTYQLYFWKVLRKLSVRQMRYGDTHRPLRSGRMIPPFRWDGRDRLPIEIRSQHDKTYEIFLSLRTVKSLHFWSVVRKVLGRSYEVVIIGHHA